MRSIKRVLVVIMAFALLFTLTPGSLGVQKAYAGNGTDDECWWVLHSVQGWHNGYAIAGTELYVTKDSLSDYDGEATPVKDAADDDEVRIRFYIKMTLDSEWEPLGESGKLSDSCVSVTVPDEADDCTYIYLEVWDQVSGWYYTNRNLALPCKTRNVDNDKEDGFMEDLGSITINLPAVGKEKIHSGVDPDAIINTLLISDYNEGCILDGGFTDFNKDGVDDANIFTDYYDGKLHTISFKDVVDMGTKSKTIRVKNGMPFGNLECFDGEAHSYRTPYYSEVKFVFAKRSVKKGTLKLKSSSLVYNGNKQLPAIKSLKVKGKTLTKGKDFKVSGSRKSIGKGTLTITGIGKYTGTIKADFKIKPGKVTVTSVTAGKKKLTVKWKKKGGNVKYVVKYRVKGSSKWSSKTVTSTASTIKTTITGLKSGKTYEVKVRAKKKVKGTWYYGKFSEISKVKVK
ncbi:MAG: fibronectin type III domain-containing protein [Firmicutes bacterium]|nr:fibronectin type III domain-containing protein [Bacillota bacterium]